MNAKTPTPQQTEETKAFTAITEAYAKALVQHGNWAEVVRKANEIADQEERGAYVLAKAHDFLEGRLMEIANEAANLATEIA